MDRRMRVASFRVRHWIFHHLAGLGIELPDISREICRVPDVAVLVRQQPVWPGLRRQLVLLELFGLRIEMSQHVGKLPRIPDRPIRSQHRIVRPRSRRRHHPLFDRNVRAAGNNLRFRLWLGREILGQVIQHCAELGIRYRRSDVDHHVQDRLPVVVVMSRVRSPASARGKWRSRFALRPCRRLPANPPVVGFDFVRASEELRRKKRSAGAAQGRKSLSST